MAIVPIQNQDLSITLPLGCWEKITDYISDTMFHFIRSDESKNYYYPWLEDMITSRIHIMDAIREAYNKEWSKDDKEASKEASNDALCEQDPRTPKFNCKHIKAVTNIQATGTRREFAYTVDTDVIGNDTLEPETRIFSYDADVYEDLKHIMDVIENYYGGNEQ